MKVKKEIIEKMIHRMKYDQQILNGFIDNYIEKFNRCTNVEEIMANKKELLLRLVSHLPIDSKHCYFCYEHLKENKTDVSPVQLLETYCDETCPYAKHHGFCSKMSSDWNIIAESREILMKQISVRYYNNENYEEIDETRKGEVDENNETTDT